jgi:hypothetical protein
MRCCDFCFCFFDQAAYMGCQIIDSADEKFERIAPRGKRFRSFSFPIVLDGSTLPTYGKAAERATSFANFFAAIFCLANILRHDVVCSVDWRLLPIRVLTQFEFESNT